MLEKETKILIVDDVEFNVLVLESMLNQDFQCIRSENQFSAQYIR